MRCWTSRPIRRAARIGFIRKPWRARSAISPTRDAVFVFDTGLNTLWSANWIRQSGSQRIIGSFNNAAVGTALGQANGIQALDRSRQVIALCGDGGFNMLMCEFLTAVHHKLPVKVVIYNNSSFGLITLEAESWACRPSGRASNFPIRISRRLRAPAAVRVSRPTKPGELHAAISEAFEADGPAIVDCVVAADELPNLPHLELDKIGNYAMAKIKEALLAVTGAVTALSTAIHLLAAIVLPAGEPGTDERSFSRTVETALSGYELLNDPLLNKGTAFTDQNATSSSLHGFLPPHVAELDYQVRRRLDAFRGLGSDIQRYIFLRGLQDSNETLFYALLTRNIEEMMPVVYTPTVGLGCQLFSHIFRKPRGLFLSLPHKDDIRRILKHPRFDGVEAIVVSDGERILGLGDQGAGGMGIPIGKLSLYTACAGLHPSTTLPIILDVGTDNREHLDDPLYIGWQHERVRGDAYDEFVAIFVAAVRERWPHVLLHWEDFAIGNANRLLTRYRDRLCTFNDDIQGTAAIAVGTLLSAINVTGTPLTEQRIAVFGAGSAGTGICALLLRAMIEAGLTEAQAHSRFYLVDRDGLLVDGMTGLQPFQAPFVQRRADLAHWTLAASDRIGLGDVVANAHPTVLIGTSGQPHAFHEAVVRAMADRVRRPIIFPLSNPTERSRSDAAGYFRLDRRPRRDRDRQSVPADRARRPRVPRRSDQQRLRLSGYRPWCHRRQSAPHLRRDVSGRSARHRRGVSRSARSASQSAASAGRIAQGCLSVSPSLRPSKRRPTD